MKINAFMDKMLRKVILKSLLRIKNIIIRPTNCIRYRFIQISKLKLEEPKDKLALLSFNCVYGASNTISEMLVNRCCTTINKATFIQLTTIVGPTVTFL